MSIGKVVILGLGLV